MFDDYIDNLAQELEELNHSEVMEDYLEHKKNPHKGYENFIARCDVPPDSVALGFGVRGLI